MQKADPIEIVSYNPYWLNIFEAEALQIKKALGENCITIHHIGSTSVQGMSAKPIIDMVPVVYDIIAVDQTIKAMETFGYEAKGEYGIVFRRFFCKKGFHVHIFEQNSSEIERHLLFKNWMQNHADDKEHYIKLKQNLALLYPNDREHYILGKDAFIKNIYFKMGFNGFYIVKAFTPNEWNAARNFRDRYFFNPSSIKDSYTWTFNHSQHKHIMFYQGVEIIGYAHIQFWPDYIAMIRIIAIDENRRNKNLGSKFLALSEKWLKSLGIQKVLAESRLSSTNFYFKNGYLKTPFKDPEGHEPDLCDIQVGKIL